MKEVPKLYLGVELNPDFAMISSATGENKTPQTISRTAGSEQYQIPVALAKRKGIGQWFYGDEAESLSSEREVIVIEDLLRQAIAGRQIPVEEESYPAEELLILFLRKVLMLPGKLGNGAEIGKLVITMPELTKATIEMMKRVMASLGLRSEDYYLIDNRESFYYYALSQDEELFLHDVALFDYSSGTLRFACLSRNQRTTPETVTIADKNFGMLYGDLDQMFDKCITDAFAHRIVTTSYLTGDGFDAAWMKDSLRTLCRGRKAFLGRNLYSKGACYAAMVKDGLLPWRFVYMGDNELKVNVSLKVRKKGEIAFVSLLSAGESWYEAEGSCEIVLMGKPEIDFWLQAPSSREARIQSVELLDFPDREDGTSRLRITAKPVSDERVRVVIKDLGFGEIARATEKSWEYLIHE